MWQAAQVSFEALTVLALELQHQPGICVEGGDSRCHAAGEGNPGCAGDKETNKNWTVRIFLTSLQENAMIPTNK